MAQSSAGEIRAVADVSQVNTGVDKNTLDIPVEVAKPCCLSNQYLADRAMFYLRSTTTGCNVAFR